MFFSKTSLPTGISRKPIRIMIVMVLMGIAFVKIGQSIVTEDYRYLVLGIFLTLCLPGLLWAIRLRKLPELFSLLLLFTFMDINSSFIQSLSGLLAQVTLVEFIIDCLAVFQLVNIALHKEHLYAPKSVVIGQAMFVLGGIIAIGFGTGHAQSIQLWIRICVFSTAVLLLTTTTVKEVRNAEYLALAMIASTIFLSLATWAASHTGYFTFADTLLIGNIQFDPFRAGGTFFLGRFSFDAHPVTLGEYQIMGFAFILPYALASWSGRTRFAARLSAVLLLVLFAILSNSRGPAISALVSSFFTLYIMRHYRLTTYKMGMFVVLSVFIVGITALLWSIAQDQSGIFAQRFLVLYKDPYSDVNLLGRLELWALFAQLEFYNPFGLGFFSYVDYGNNPHNLLLYLGLGTGVIGIAGFTTVFVLFVRELRRGIIQFVNPRLRLFCVGAAGVGVVALTSGMSSIFIHQQYKIAGLFVVMGAVFALMQLQRKEQIERPE